MPFVQAPFWATRYAGVQSLHPVAVVVTPPTVEPVTLVQVKQRLNIFVNDDDAELVQLVTAARQQVELDLGGACLGTTVVDQWFDRTPTNRILPLLRWPVTAITSVKTHATDDTETVFAAGEYLVDLVTQRGRVILNDDASWPTGLRSYRGVVVRYTCGFTNGIPETYKLAMLFLIAHWFKHREAVVVGHSSAPLQWSYEALLSDAPMTIA